MTSSFYADPLLPASKGDGLRRRVSLRRRAGTWVGTHGRTGETRGDIISKETMPFTISDEVLTAAHISEPELKRELALSLFQQERLTLAQASRLAEMSQLAFQSLLAERQIPIHYGVQEFREDLRTLRQTEQP